MKNFIFQFYDENLLSAWFKVFWSSRNGSFVFNQIFVYGTLMGVDYKSERNYRGMGLDFEFQLV